MFENSVGMAVLAASDLSRALKYWHEVLGLDPVQNDDSGATFMVGGTPVLVYESQFAGTAQSTAFGILTDDLDRDMAALRERGVTFNDYDLPGLTTVDGVFDFGDERVAWFNDSEGNILSIGQPAGGRLEEVRQMIAARR